MTDESVDPAELRGDVERIKEAMGIAERYRTAPSQWAFFGAFVAVGAAACQYLVLRALPGYWVGAVWLAILAGAASFAGYSRSVFERTPAEKPNIPFQILMPYLAGLPLAAISWPFLPALAYTERIALTLSLALLLLGVGHVLAANALRAYSIQARDRWAFALGGVLLVALAVATAHVEVLHTWGYAAFGATYFGYSLASYVVLTRP